MVYVGIDIAKLKFDACFDTHHIQKANQKKKFANFANTQEGIEEFCAQLPDGVFVIFESTGSYSKLLYKTLCQKGIRCCCVNPYRVLQFRRALGRLIKTDKTDAETLALYGEKIKPQPTIFMNEANEELRELVRARQQIMDTIHAYRNRLEVPCVSEFLNTMYDGLLDHLSVRLKLINQQINEFLLRHLDHKHKVDRLCTIVGISTISAVNLLAHCPELGTLSKQQIGIIFGLCPNTKQSGTTYMCEHIYGGRSEARRTLFMCAQVARKYNSEMGMFCDRLLRKGKPPKVDLTAVMNKLAIHANAVLKHDVDYEVHTPPPEQQKVA